jgi:hypothetical protein
MTIIINHLSFKHNQQVQPRCASLEKFKLAELVMTNDKCKEIIAGYK